MTDGYFTERQIRIASQCWGSPWRVAEREPATEMVARSLGGVSIEFPVALQHPMPTKMIRLHPNEMQRLGMGIPVKIGKVAIS